MLSGRLFTIKVKKVRRIRKHLTLLEELWLLFKETDSTE